ncbi:MAG: response regulator transcription factor [Verrucomicrobiae bacterium]|nr:response regulator transcription factor [Verrucomicrobiae bacterium]
MTQLTQTLRLAIVEDDAGYRQELVTGLEARAGWMVVAACATAESALREIPLRRPDLVLIDLRLPSRPRQVDNSGLRLIPELRQRLPAARLVVLSVSEDPSDILGAIQEGAAAYISKGETLDDLAEQIQIVLADEACMSPSIARKVVDWFQRNRPLEQDPGYPLSAREWEILDQTARGRSHSEIAGALGISPNTVRNHFARIYGKLGVSSAAAVIYKVGPLLRIREALRQNLKQR